jgi:hypothetical protein
MVSLINCQCLVGVEVELFGREGGINGDKNKITCQMLDINDECNIYIYFSTS